MADVRVPLVCAVVVSYHPDPAALSEVCQRVAGQVGAVVVVDNGSRGPWKRGLASVLRDKRGALLEQADNIGLAAAQNIGIDWARRHGFEYVLILDQDSMPAQDMVAGLWDALQGLPPDPPVAAVGPRFHDFREDRDAPFVRIGFPFNRKIWSTSKEATVSCSLLISSGSLIPMSVLNHVGAMNEGLFIDNVDLEWGFRAQAHGYALYGVNDAVMEHRLGDARRRLPFGWGQVVVHGPVRLYFMMRNRLRLYRMSHVPRIWIAQDIPRLLVKLFLFGVLVGPRWRNLRAMWRGMRDGLEGGQGPCPEPLRRYLKR